MRNSGQRTWRGHAVVAVVLALFGGCAAVGSDRNWHRLMPIGNRIVMALEQHRQAKGTYPARLTDMPELADLSEKISPADGFSGYTIYYRPSDNGFSLSITFVPSWPNLGLDTCEFDPRMRYWRCSGAI